LNPSLLSRKTFYDVASVIRLVLHTGRRGGWRRRLRRRGVGDGGLGAAAGHGYPHVPRWGRRRGRVVRGVHRADRGRPGRAALDSEVCCAGRARRCR
jgi:hypothetical protein